MRRSGDVSNLTLAAHAALRLRFDADVMQAAIAAVHVPRWAEWEALVPSTLVVLPSMDFFTEDERAELIARRPATLRRGIAGAVHDAHLEAFTEWMEMLSENLQ